MLEEAAISSMALRLDGKALAKAVEARLSALISSFSSQAGRPPGLAVLRVGDDPASAVYVANKEKACARIGVASFGAHLPAGTPASEVLATIQALNADPRVMGSCCSFRCRMVWTKPRCFRPLTLKRMPMVCTPESRPSAQRRARSAQLHPCWVMAMLNSHGIDPAGQRAVVIGRSILVGQPMALMLQAANATVTVTHSRTTDLKAHTREADILVVAAGRPEMIGAEHVKPGAAVVDVGIHRKPEGGLCGDVRFAEVEPIASALSPVPGGVGPMTVTMCWSIPSCPGVVAVIWSMDLTI